MELKDWEEAALIHARLKSRNITIEPDDIFIAAFCIVREYTLVTNNTKHFKHIDGLMYTDWRNVDLVP
jgi:predicted nucleic acid-binding protein